MSEQAASIPELPNQGSHEAKEITAGNYLPINYQLCFESINWLQHYFDYHNETKTLNTVKPDDDISSDEFIAFAAENNLTPPGV